MASARSVVLHEWSLRRTVQFDTSGGWHKCSLESCNIMQLKERVCIVGKHVVATDTCAEHGCNTVLVNDLYVCQKVGCVHVCDQRTCEAVSGRCVISGLCCVEQQSSVAYTPASNRRCRRRSPNVHTCKQAANILLYDLLFSNRRIAAEIYRVSNILDVARRLAQREIRQHCQERCHISFQSLLDKFTHARLKLNNNSHLFVLQNDAAKRKICLFYSSYILRVWNCLLHYLPSRTTFEPVAAALLYSMRRGIAYDGLFAIPFDKFIACALPDAHSIKDVDINRRLFTQAKNALFDAVQHYVDSKGNSVQSLASEYRTTERPDCLARYFDGRTDEQ